MRRNLPALTLAALVCLSCIRDDGSVNDPTDGAALGP